MARIKGTTLVEVVKALRKQRSRVSPLLDPSLRRYLDRQILVGGWYPEEDFLALLKVFVPLVYQARGWERAGIASARRDLATVYGNALRPGDVMGTVAMLPALWRNYHDTGRVAVVNEPGQTDLEILDHPVADADMCRLRGAFYAEILTLAGALVTSTQKIRCTANRDESCLWRFAWTKGLK
jgi:hypothetical protein